ncbi:MULTISPECIES: type II CRISPR-associated endonuclease Cas1 [unclassified Lactobacillus]|uniref:type II CRISPR-associated endonuclease Cas1 n=1 Tax=unclassified Lactobacillus TaxID=2620435 RepID=UPI00226AC3BB|nr:MULTISPECIES: type II CRISPR-associated endonuclease Cas1 [unclassified Lactobacillus]MCX8720666.1 type II CRISPR-associated endonuclease Cas1 [Lactobacillus sp. B4010]MCX8724102.1 type II CRISPR-associated endonuclease Cas1 [Lactobacillus sp. B4005]MCX8731878.1 type II CRISPR-associated endonuclease Cas1 [Lactobacillus sp. B4015]MCX8733848.1 type II CRISPR-associated endonuclease Cas1 [Lactobacillus sp. B4012]
MGWRSVIITQHAKMTYSMNMMVVQTRDGISQIPIADINLLLVSTTQAVITSALISKLAENQTKVIFVDEKDEPVVETVGYYPGARNLSKLNIQFNWDLQLKEKLWTKIVDRKITNQIAVLKNYQLEWQNVQDELDQLELNDATNREAIAARKYFVTLFDKTFIRRDNNAVNGALDYGYAILLASFNREIAVNGYLSYLGIHHHSEENCFNLASDLMEPFRPFVDYWVKAHEKIKQLTPDIKYGLVELLSLEIEYNNKKTILSNVISEYVHDCLCFLSEKTKELPEMEMALTNEVPNDALNDNV